MTSYEDMKPVEIPKKPKKVPSPLPWPKVSAEEETRIKAERERIRVEMARRGKIVDERIASHKLRDYEYPDIARRFYMETWSHEIKILRDDGLYRHLRFMGTEDSAYWFDLITWPGNLVFRGDGETFAFTRAQDMFEFFRSGIYKDGSLHINVSYWEEKLTIDRGAVRKYDQEAFEKDVKEYVAERIRDGSAPRGIGKAVKEEILDDWSIGDEGAARKLLAEFDYGGSWRFTCSCGWKHEEETYGNGYLKKLHHVRNAEAKHQVRERQLPGFTFEDFLERDFREYDWWFLWALYGVIWGIREYDRVKAAQKAKDRLKLRKVLRIKTRVRNAKMAQ